MFLTNLLPTLAVSEVAAAPSSSSSIESGPSLTWSSTPFSSDKPFVQQGAAILRDSSCLPDIEHDCVSPGAFSVCCPSAFSYMGTYNFRCCSPRTKCAPERLCAISSWALYDNGEYFCCGSGLLGYIKSGYSLCSNPEAPMISGVILLPTLTIEQTAAPSLSSSSSSKSEVSSASSSNAAIVGRIIGDVVGIAILARIAWVMLRQQRQNKVENASSPEDISGDNATKDRSGKNAVGGLHMNHQLDDWTALYCATDERTMHCARIIERPAQSPPINLWSHSCPFLRLQGGISGSQRIFVAKWASSSYNAEDLVIRVHDGPSTKEYTIARQLLPWHSSYFTAALDKHS
ncbi:hypothetical protein BU25DRAFT_421564 [Macroventuria anomochaeta]|uniref:Uncharacterized protein n=1 Tax=Macroventuria anomochaeta TaxID=301207 RepID=A0ACB6S2E4_9PLEO|nr:uncharacterized protein BU25DRAFT_421564 [Macroventuria anomochaeta]KAF2627563.1 hypothetical protein BU25DRAFT_421564 [Macroventuria anomochaeta]